MPGCPWRVRAAFRHALAIASDRGTIPVLLLACAPDVLLAIEDCPCTPDDVEWALGRFLDAVPRNGDAR